MTTGMFKIILLFLGMLIPSFTICQNLYQKLAEEKIANDAILIERLQIENSMLQKEIESLKINTASNDAKLEEALNQLYLNNLILKEKSYELKVLEENLALLTKEKSILTKQLKELNIALEESNLKNTLKEQQISKLLEESGKSAIIDKARESAANAIIFKQKDVAYFRIYTYKGEQLEPINKFNIFCTSISKRDQYVVFRIHFIDRIKPRDITLKGQGDYKIFHYKNYQYKVVLIGLKELEDGKITAKVKIQKIAPVPPLTRMSNFFKNVFTLR